MGAYGPSRGTKRCNGSWIGSHELKDAPETILDVTDMVFVDPVGTGYSRALGDTDSKAFGLKSRWFIADFIAQWTKETLECTNILLGESYGTTRAAAVLKCLWINT